jgi:hypothetical protein
MEKSSLNIKYFWNIFSRGRAKSYTLPRDNGTEGVKYTTANGGVVIDNIVTNCSAENIYSMRYRKSKKIDNQNECDRKCLRVLFIQNLGKCQRIYSNNFCLPIFTPVTCR